MLTINGEGFGNDVSAVEVSFIGSAILCEVRTTSDDEIQCYLESVEVHRLRNVKVRIGNQGKITLETMCTSYITI